MSSVINLRVATPTIASDGATLVDNGYAPLPIKPGTKNPDLPGWSRIDADHATIERWKAEGRGDWGIGIRGDHTPGVDLDISDESVLGKVLAWSDANIGVVNRRTGRAPRVLFICRSDAPFRKMSSRKFQSPDGATHQIEVLGKGTQYVAYAIHPDTQRPYQWEGADPLSLPAELLPTLMPEKAKALIEYFESVVPGSWVPVSKASIPSAVEHEGNPRKTAALHRVRSAMEAIPNKDLPYEDWIRVMYALWIAVDEHKYEGLEIFDEWSARSEKYDPEETHRVWSATHDVKHIGAGTLFHLAKQNGWVEPPEDLTAWMEVVEGIDDERPGDDVGEVEAAAASNIDPVDLWGKFEPPPLPRGLLPPIIENFAFEEARIMGADPAGLAMAAITVSAAAIPDSIKLQVKEHHAGWLESARIWTVLAGNPSTRKSPIMRTAARPLRDIDNALVKQFILEKKRFDNLSKEDKKSTREPIQKRALIEDVTVEAAIDVLSENPEGALCYQDELSGWLGSMDKYSGGRGSHKDRAVWLQAFNGGPYSLNRVSRGVVHIPNLSVSLLGGVQPDTIRKVAVEGVDDGLIQRFLPIILRPAEIGIDDAEPTAALAYAAAVRRLRTLDTGLDETPETEIVASPGDVLRFSAGGQSVRKDLERYLHELQVVETMSPKLAAHFGKLDGIFARLCIVWHCIENIDSSMVPLMVEESVARRVYRFLTDFLLKHSISFYMSMLDFTDHADVVLACAGHILAHPEKKEISARDFRRGDSLMKSVPTNADREKTLEKLEFLGWVTAIGNKAPGAPARWRVNPEVHKRYADRASKEASRRSEIRRVLANLQFDGVAA